MRRLGRLTGIWTKHEAGQDAAEYALILAFLVIVILVAVAAFGTSLAAAWAAMAALLP